MQLHPRMRGSQERVCVLSPWSLTSWQQNLVLEGYLDGEEKPSKWNILLMKDVIMLEGDSAREPVHRTEPEETILSVKRSGLMEFMEFFGADVKIEHERPRTVEAHIRADGRIVRQ